MQKSESHIVSSVHYLLRIIKIFARKHYKYPYPEEPFFQEIAERSICEAHGTGDRKVVTGARMLLLWQYIKGQSLRYIVMVQSELRERYIHPAQKIFYARKFKTEVGLLDAKVELLKNQFSDQDDILK